MRQWVAILENKFRDETFITAQIRFRARSEHEAYQIIGEAMTKLDLREIRIAGMVEMTNALLQIQQ